MGRVVNILGIRAGLLLEVLQDSESLVDFAIQSFGGVEELEELGVVHLEQHTSDLASEVGMSAAKQETRNTLCKSPNLPKSKRIEKTRTEQS